MILCLLTDLGIDREQIACIRLVPSRRRRLGGGWIEIALTSGERVHAVMKHLTLHDLCELMAWTAAS